MPSTRLRAISPVIAIIIIIAITLSIAFAVVGWLFGLWGGIAGGTPQISITNAKVYQVEVKEKAEEGKEGKTKYYAVIELYIVNRGSGSDKVLIVELVKGSTVVSKSANLETSVISANMRTWVTYSIDITDKNLSLEPGDSVLVKLYFENSGVYSIPVVVSPSKSG